MVNLAICAECHAGHQPKLRSDSAAVLVLLVMALISGPAANAQQSSSPGNGPISREDRVTRLSDSLASGQDWDIGVPVIAVESVGSPSSEAPSELTLAESVRLGRALDSEAYLALDRELRQLQWQLQARPEDDAARRQLEELRGALIERIEANTRLGYLYAAAVYVELLRQAGGSADTVAGLSERLMEERLALRR